MGAFNSTPETETINWKNIKTDQVSEIPNLYGISNEANNLLEKLNLQQISSETETSNNLDNLFVSKVNNSATNNQVSENFSSTSPFISSEMYNYVMNKYQTQNMVGGAIKNTLDEDSNTSSTSSSTKLTSDEKLKDKKKSKNNKKMKGKVSKTNKKVTENFIDYLSSSAHTGGSLTDSSILNENTISVSSVRTSQINLISE